MDRTASASDRSWMKNPGRAYLICDVAWGTLHTIDVMLPGFIIPLWSQALAVCMHQSNYQLLAAAVQWPALWPSAVPKLMPHQLHLPSPWSQCQLKRASLWLGGPLSWLICGALFAEPSHPTSRGSRGWAATLGAALGQQAGLLRMGWEGLAAAR